VSRHVSAQVDRNALQMRHKGGVDDVDRPLAGPPADQLSGNRQ
jgi:hypothetical protein